MRKRIPRRQRLLLTTAVAAFAVLAAASAAVLVRRPARPYNPGETVEGITSDLSRPLPPNYPRVTFTEVAESAGIRFRHFYRERSTQLPEDMGSGVAWGDYDNDGDDDLFVVNICGPLTLPRSEARSSPATCRLYRNEGGGHGFVDVTAEAGLTLRACGMGAAWGDVDGDGWLDLAVTSYPDLYLFRNDRRGGFSDAGKRAGVSRHKGFWTGASWSDYDRDGDLDLYVCGYVRYRFNASDQRRISRHYQGDVPYTLNPSSYEPERNLLLQNDGRGVFQDVARAAGVENTAGRSLSAAWCDFDGDGRDDLYVANDVSDNAMYRNLGGTAAQPGSCRFRDIAHAAWVADFRGAMGLGVGDWDSDGDFDLFVSHWIAQENALYSSLRIRYPGSPPGPLQFVDVADQHGLGQIALDFIGWGTSFFDYDNDGRPDLFVANGSTFEEEQDRTKLISMRHLLFWNQSNEEGFHEVSRVSGAVFRQATVGRGAAFADYDDDGDVDLFVLNHGAAPWLLRNDGGSQNRWLKVKARGRKNRFGVGAQVKVTVGGVTQIQQVGSQPSYLSQNSFTAHFGVGAARTVDQVVVIFPGGAVARRTGVESNQTLTIGEV
jgi:hypothetical protein